MQPGLKERVADAAKKNNRSMNSEIVARLEGDLARDELERVTLRLPDDLLDRINATAHHQDVSRDDLIVEALQAAFPPHTLTLGEIVSRIGAALDSGQVSDAEQRRELDEYRKGAEALIKADPKFKSISVDVDKYSR